MSGVLFGVSLGPGDPGLITRKAWDVLHSGAQWVYPVRRKGADSFALCIVARAGLDTPSTALELIFPMTHDTEILSKYWIKAAHTVIEILKEGRDVCFLVEGDASTYSTFSHLARSVSALYKSVTIEIVAGVSAYNAAAATIQMPLANPDDVIAIIPANYGIQTLDVLLNQVDTLVLYKVKPVLDEVIDWLIQRDLIEHAKFIERVGSPEEVIVTDIASLKGMKVNYLSLMLVKNIHHMHGKIIRGCRKK